MQVLNMLAEGKITAAEAEGLLYSLDQHADSGEAGGVGPRGRPRAKYLRVVVGSDTNAQGEEATERVNIRVPVALIRAGVRLAALIPGHAAKDIDAALEKKGIKFKLSDFKPEDLDPLIDALTELEVDVQDGSQKVRIFAE